MVTELDPTETSPHPRVPATVIAGMVALVFAAWLASGSSGVWAHSMRTILVLILMLIAGLILPINKPLGRVKHLKVLVLLWGPALGLLATDVMLGQIAAVAWQAVILGAIGRETEKPLYRSLGASLVIFLCYRWAVDALPWMWLLGDAKARAIGAIIGGLWGRPMTLGMTLAAFDLWLLVTVLTLALWLQTPRPRGRRGLWLCAAIIFPQALYLTGVAYLPAGLAWLRAREGQATPFWVSFLLKALPWHAPLIDGLLFGVVLVLMLRWLPGLIRPVSKTKRSAPAAIPWLTRQRWIVLGLACLLPLVTSLHIQSHSLDHKKIVFYEKGFLNWLRPDYSSYGRLSSGMYGMLPTFLQSLGATTLISPELAQPDLDGADVVVLLFPDDPWLPGQRQRLWNYVRAGGTLLVMGEHTTEDPNGANRFNEILAPTAMRVAFDSATFTVGGWLHSYEALIHPATVGIGDRSNDFGVVIGASLQIHFPARPLLIGRWGWSDRGDLGNGPSMMGNDVYDPGEKLGDLILAAEQPLGRGRVVVFGDTSGLTNGINVGSHHFNRRLFTYLAQKDSASPAWRQLLGFLLWAGLVVMLLWGVEPGKLLLAVIGLIISMAVTLMVTERSMTGLPDGRLKTPNNLAYIDLTHMGANSSESWRDNGIGGLVLTLMRNGYLALNLNQFTSERLERAGLLLCLSPRQSFSAREIKRVQDYVNKGGLLIITGGYEHFRERQSLLEAFDFHVGRPAGETAQPRALGYFKAPYLRSDNARVFVRFYEAWPVYCSSPEGQVLAYGPDNLPVAMWRPWGGGKVVVFGDTAFAQNLNLEHEDGSPFEGLRENADFWRWLLSWLRDQEMWVPPAVRDQNDILDLGLDLGLEGQNP